MAKASCRWLTSCYGHTEAASTINGLLVWQRTWLVALMRPLSSGNAGKQYFRCRQQHKTLATCGHRCAHVAQHSDCHEHRHSSALARLRTTCAEARQQTKRPRTFSKQAPECPTRAHETTKIQPPCGHRAHRPSTLRMSRKNGLRKRRGTFCFCWPALGGVHVCMDVHEQTQERRDRCMSTCTSGEGFHITVLYPS